MCEACGPLALLSRAEPATGRTAHRRHHTPTAPTIRNGPVRTDRFADLVVAGGPILAMDAGGSRPEAVAIRDGRFVAVGSVDEIATHVGPGTETLGLDGRTLLPGLVDPHMHAVMVQMIDWVDVSPMTNPTADDVMRTLRHAESASTGWMLANGFDPNITDGHPKLDREVLDRLIPDRPALVFESNGHVAYANSAALLAAGVDRNTPDPPAARRHQGLVRRVQPGRHRLPT